MKHTNVVAIIPARGGSKRIPCKNVKPFNGVPMIGRSINAATRSGLFERVLISTDSEEIARVGIDFGAECAFRRPPELADDLTATAPVVHHALQWMAEEGTPAEYACCIYATAPFIQIEDLQDAFQILVEHSCGSVFTVSTFEFPVLRALRLTTSGSLAMLWPEYHTARSQDLPETYHDAGQFYWLNVARFMREPTLYCSDSRPLVVPRWRAQDIDTQEDWDRAACMHRVLTEQNLIE